MLDTGSQFKGGKVFFTTLASLIIIVNREDVACMMI